MYCPNCKSEFKAGITVCPNCKVDLVEQLVAEEDEMKLVITVYTENLKEKISSYLTHISLEFMVNEEPADPAELPDNPFFLPDDIKADELIAYKFFVAEKDRKQAATEINTVLSVEAKKFAEEHPEILEEAMKQPKPAPAKVYVSAKDRSGEYKSSGYMFIVMGLIIGVLDLLVYLKVINLNLAPISLILLAIMTVLCFICGVLSIRKSKSISKTISAEESVEESVRTFIKENFSNISVEDFKEEGISDEIAFLNMTESIKEKVTEAFPESDEDFLDQLIDEFVGNLE